MQVSLLACYIAIQECGTVAPMMTLLILWVGYLLFGLDPTPDDEEEHS